MRNRVLLAAVLASVAVPAMSFASPLYSDSFSTAADALNYNVIATTGATGPSSDATFGYDYSALGIPSAPNSGDSSTLGLRVRVDNLQTTTQSGIVLGALEVATKSSVVTLPSQFTLSVDVWGNYIGGSNITASGSNGSTSPGVGIGTSGTSLQSPNSNDGFIADSFHDGGGGTNADYRVYVDNQTRPTPANSTYFPSATTTHTDTYYTSFLPGVSAPSAEQTGFASTQTGTSPAGTIAFRWTTWIITDDGTNVTWSIDNDAATNPVTKVIATVPVSKFTSFGGNNISLDSFDSGLTGNSAANNQTLNMDIFDNLVITPEPASISLLGLGAMSLLARRRK